MSLNLALVISGEAAGAKAAADQTATAVRSVGVAATQASAAVATAEGQAEAARHGGVGVVEAMRLGRRGYATGGAVEGAMAMPATGTSGSGASSSSPTDGKTQRVSIEVNLSRDLTARILEEAGNHSVRLISQNDQARTDYYNAGGNPR